MSKIKRIKQSSKIDNFKLITSWLIGKNVNINSVLNDKVNEDDYKYKLFSYLLNHPKLIWYVNKYLNSLYTFNKYDLYYWLETFKIIFTRYNIISINNIYLSKYKPAKRISIKNEFENYINKNFKYIPSQDELNNIYRLYNYKLITEEKYLEIKEINSGKEQVNKKLPIVLDSVINKKDEKTIQSESILEFTNKLTNYINQRILCKNCPLFSNEKYILESNLDNKGNKSKLDVIIIGEHPISENLLSNYKYIKELIHRYNLTYLITNLVVCKPNSNEIPNADKTIANCKGVTEHIHNTFRSKFKILIGNKVKKAFNIKGPLSKVNGEIINDLFIMAPPLNINLHKQGLIKLNEYLEKYAKTKLENTNIDKQSINSNNINFNSNLKNYTLFDIKIIDEKLLYIFLENETGKKKYITEEISFPIYIKRGTYQQCEFLSKHCDFVTYLTNQQRISLMQLMNKRLSEYIQI